MSTAEAPSSSHEIEVHKFYGQVAGDLKCLDEKQKRLEGDLKESKSDFDSGMKSAREGMSGLHHEIDGLGSSIRKLVDSKEEKYREKLGQETEGLKKSISLCATQESHVHLSQRVGTRASKVALGDLSARVDVLEDSDNERIGATKASVRAVGWWAAVAGFILTVLITGSSVWFTYSMQIEREQKEFEKNTLKKDLERYEKRIELLEQILIWGKEGPQYSPPIPKQ